MGNEADPPPFDPTRLAAHYQRLVTELARWHPYGVINSAINSLFDVADDVTKMRHFQPWNLLLLIQWTVRNFPFDGKSRPLVSRDEYHGLLNILHEMEGVARMPNEYNHHLLFLRQLAIKQFWLQHGISGDAFARQYLLFGQLPANHQFATRFLKEFGFTIDAGIELSFALTAPFLKDGALRSVRREQFAPFERHHPPGTLECFFRHLSRDLQSLWAYLDDVVGSKYTLEEEIQMDTPLLRYPLLELRGHYFPYSPILLYRALPALVYRSLKEIEPEWFCARFGPIFENYMSAGLAESGLVSWRETELTRKLGGIGKTADFLLMDANSVVLIDAKSVELSFKGKTSHVPEVVFQSIKSTAWKGVEQGMETAARLRRATLPAPFASAPTAPDIFLLVVSYEPLHLGSGADFASAVAGGAVDRLRSKHGGELPFPFEHVFFLSIDEFDRLLERIRTGTASLSAILHRARANNCDRTTAKFEFIQHLESVGPQTTRSPRLQKTLDGIAHRAAAKLAPPINPSRF